ncbi:uncharacterized protein LOC119671544 [Teleopsis dalmanni]|uniref:uncharacterized protein LOC119671544 n=2 Tax=Teleopsis dalmanni TaxID=139649 RepID=UPI0018CE0054|nr:uncharacterized protein LOC119671544 [Teleopsis dalmanni]
MTTKESSSENLESDRSEERPLSKCISCLNTDKSIGDNITAVLISDFNLSDSSEAKSSDSVPTLNVLNTNQNFAEFDNTNTVNESFKISMTPQTCNSTKLSEEDKTVKICGLDDNNDLDRVMGKSQYQPEFSSACAGEEILNSINAECSLREGEINPTICGHISNYFRKKRSLFKLVAYLDGVYRRRLSDVNTLSENNVELEINMYKSWISSLEKLTDAIFRNLKQFRLDLVHQLAHELLRVEGKKQEQEIIRKCIRDTAKLNKIYAEVQTTGQWRVDFDFETSDKNDLLDPTKECKFENLF